MSSRPEQLPPNAALSQMIMSGCLTHSICVAAELGVADALNDGPRTASELARAVGANPDALYRILRALAATGIFRETQEGRFEHSGLSECLRSDIAGSMRAWARMVGADWNRRVMSEMLHSARTGEPVVERALGTPLWEYFAQHKEHADIFNDSMTSFSSTEIDAVMGSYDFSGIQKLVDIGGGLGSLLATILKAYPHMQGVLADAPSVIDSARREIDKYGLGDRCELVGIDFFESVPAGGDAYMMKHIIHDWDDEHSLRILKNCHAVMQRGARLLVVDSIIAPGNEPSVGKTLDLFMLLIGGRERTEAEFRTLFERAGFELTRIVPTSSPVAVVEGRKT
jgi:ubiquinone/menaquinone biosynthesis C-methylase UbiE